VRNPGRRNLPPGGRARQQGHGQGSSHERPRQRCSQPLRDPHPGAAAIGSPISRRRLANAIEPISAGTHSEITR